MSNHRVVTTFLLQEDTTTFFPTHDPQRVCPDEHHLDFISYSSNGTRASATYRDPLRRRWYEINTLKSSPIKEDFWLEKTLMHHIVSQSQPFNTVTIDEYGNAIYEIKETIGRSVQGLPIVSGSIFPIVYFHEITQKEYISDFVDTCVWNGINCFYKQIEEDWIIPRIKREISIRETVLHHFGETDNDWLSKHGISPIVIVVGEESHLLCGIIFPDAGIALDEISDDQITLQHLISLLKAVTCLHVANVLHGNICEQNVCIEGSSIQLINFDRIALDYTSDVEATGRLILQCVNRMTTSNDQANKIREAARELIEGDDLSWALSILE
jgi:hypothetical protein